MATKRTTYDEVEAQAVKVRRKGHDVKLYFRYTGMLQVFHNGEVVLEDGPRDYSVAFAKVQAIGSHETPELEPNDNVTDKSVRRGKQVRTKKAVAEKVAAEKSKAKNVASANAAAMQENGNN